MTATGDAEVKLSERLEALCAIKGRPFTVAERAESLILMSEAAELARSVEDAAVVIFDSEEDDDEPRLSEWRQEQVVALHGQRVRIVPEAGQGGANRG